jgi:hypothetical protein
VDWTHNTYIHEEVGSVLQELRTLHQSAHDELVGTLDSEAEGHSPWVDDDVIIAVAELLVLVVLTVASLSVWSEKIILYAGDNTNVRDWLRRRQAKPPMAQELLKLLVMLEALHRFEIVGTFLRTYHNFTADAITRMDSDSLDALVKSKGLTRLAALVDLRAHMPKVWSARSLIWAGQSENQRRVALQLSSRREGTPLTPCLVPAVSPPPSKDG